MLTVNSLAGVGNVTTDTPLVLTSIYNMALTSASVNMASRTAVLLTPIVITGYNRFRVTVQSGSVQETFSAGYLGQKTGTYSFAATPTQITWNGLGSVVVPANSTATSDIISFTPSGTGTLCMAFNLGADATINARRDNNATGYAFYFKTGADASTVSKTGYTAAGTNRQMFVSLVEAGVA